MIKIYSGEIASLELKSMGGYRLLVNETGIHPKVGFRNGERANRYNQIISILKTQKESNKNDFLIFNVLSR